MIRQMSSFGHVPTAIMELAHSPRFAQDDGHRALNWVGTYCAAIFYPCTDNKNGCSNASAIQRRKRAASAPSINR
jgi:hypothetical protein